MVRVSLGDGPEADQMGETSSEGRKAGMWDWSPAAGDLSWRPVTEQQILEAGGGKTGR